MITHQAYFKFLAATDQDAPVWQPVLAGLVVMRMIDSRVGSDPHSVSNWDSVESIRNAVKAISEGDPVRAILLQLVEAVKGTEIQRAAVGRGLLAYGRALDFDGQWAMACDVYETADRVAGAPNDPGVSIESKIALGTSSRRLGHWDAAELACARAAYLAGTVGDTPAALQVEIGRANAHMQRGNLPVAESILEEVIQEARAIGSSEVLAGGLLSRASVAHLRGEYGDAVRIGYEALETTNNPTTRDRILSDIAAAFAGLGLRDPARDGYLIIAGTAQSQWVRWQATLNLMEIAALDGREADFDAYAREMEAAPLEPRLHAYYFIFLGAGEQRFGRDAEAEISLAKGLAIAEKNQLHQIAHEASVAIEELKSHDARTREITSSPTEIDASLQTIVSELSSLREALTSSP